MSILRNLVRHDAADPGFVERVKAAFMTAEQAEQNLNGSGAMSSAESARLRMLGRMGLLESGSSADDARRRMIQRRERTSE